MIDSTCRVHIDWNNFRHNLRLLMQKGKTLMPVIKADAYGHGVLRASEELSALGIDWAAIGTLDEGRQVRDHGYKGHIVSLLCPVLTQKDIKLAREKDILPTVHHWEGLKTVDAALRAENEADSEPFRIAVKINSGMNRLGFTLDEMDEVAAFIAENGRISPVLLLSHLAVADEPEQDEYTARQADIFFKAADIMRKRFPQIRCSLGNTAGLMTHTERAGDVCRPGLAAYGYNPLFGTSREGACDGLKPVMSVSVPLITVHPLHAGESVGYGRAYVAESERLIGWAAIGYADGYRRNPAPATCMCVNGVRVPVIGRVAMQSTCLDLTELPEPPKAGDRAYVMGGPGDAVTAQELADWWGTIPYEVLCLLGKNTKD